MVDRLGSEFEDNFTIMGYRGRFCISGVLEVMIEGRNCFKVYDINLKTCSISPWPLTLTDKPMIYHRGVMHTIDSLSVPFIHRACSFNIKREFRLLENFSFCNFVGTYVIYINEKVQMIVDLDKISGQNLANINNLPSITTNMRITTELLLASKYVFLRLLSAIKSNDLILAKCQSEKLTLSNKYNLKYEKDCPKSSTTVSSLALLKCTNYLRCYEAFKSSLADQHLNPAPSHSHRLRRHTHSQP